MGTRIRRCLRLIKLWLSYKPYNVKYDKSYDKILQSFCNDSLNPSIEYFSDGSPCRIVFSKGCGLDSKLFSFNLTEPLLSRLTMHSVLHENNGKLIYDLGESVSGVRASFKTILEFLDIFEKRYTSEDYNRSLIISKIRKECPLYEELIDA